MSFFLFFFSLKWPLFYNCGHFNIGPNSWSFLFWLYQIDLDVLVILLVIMKLDMPWRRNSCSLLKLRVSPFWLNFRARSKEGRINIFLIIAFNLFDKIGNRLYRLLNFFGVRDNKCLLGVLAASGLRVIRVEHISLAILFATYERLPLNPGVKLLWSFTLISRI